MTSVSSSNATIKIRRLTSQTTLRWYYIMNWRDCASGPVNEWWPLTRTNIAPFCHFFFQVFLFLCFSRLLPFICVSFFKSGKGCHGYCMVAGLLVCPFCTSRDKFLRCSLTKIPSSLYLRSNALRTCDWVTWHYSLRTFTVTTMKFKCVLFCFSFPISSIVKTYFNKQTQKMERQETVKTSKSFIWGMLSCFVITEILGANVSGD